MVPRELRIERLANDIITESGMGQQAARKLAAYIVAEVDQAPPLTADQLNQLALLLRDGDGGGTDR